MERHLYRITLLAVLALAVLGGAGLSQAQDDARERISAAYRAVEGWQSYHVQVDETSDYAMTAQGAQAATWQRRERDLALSGGYDVTDRDNAQIVLDLSSRVSGSVEQGGTQTPNSWDIDLRIAQANDGLFWQGSLQAEPAEDFALPEAWEPFTSANADKVPALADLTLSRYLLENGVDPFLVDAQVWLDAAESIEGPRPFDVDRTRTGDLYVVTVDPAQVPDLFEGRFLALTEGQNALVARDDLLRQLQQTGAVTWGVALDPASGDLIAQFIQLDLEAEIRGSLLQTPYTSMSLAFRSDQSVVFSAVNEPVALPDDLPQS